MGFDNAEKSDRMKVQKTATLGLKRESCNALVERPGHVCPCKDCGFERTNCMDPACDAQKGELTQQC